jgi:hypothetical protein
VSEVITLNSQSYTIPDPGDINWGQNLTDYFVAIPAGVLQKSAGLFTLTADVDFGANFGVKSLFWKSRASDVADAGQIRLGHSDVIDFRNALNSGNLPIGVNASNQLTFNSVALQPVTLTDAHILVGSASNLAADVAMTGDIAITNAGVTSIGAGKIVDAQVNASAAIAVSKLAALTFSKAVVSTGAGVLTTATTSATEIGYVAGVTSAIQTQMDLKAPLANPTFSGTITTPLTNSRAVATGGSGQLAVSTTTAAELDFVHGVTSAIQTQMDLKSPLASPTFTGTVTAAALTTTGLNTPTGGIKGKTGGTDATAGNVGEYIESVVGPTNFPGTGTFGDLTSITLTAGDWDVTFQFEAVDNGATVPSMFLGISTTSGNSNTGLVNGSNLYAGPGPVAATGGGASGSVASWRKNVSGSTIVYAKYRASFSVATPQCYGRLSARRVQPGT